MKQLNALLVDDDVNILQGLSSMIHSYCPEIKVAGTAQNLSEAAQLIGSVHPEIIFLDVRFPGAMGFDIVEVAQARKCSVIFVSGHHDYAAMAYRVDAVDYLLKPIDYRELQVAVTRAINRRENIPLPPANGKLKVRIMCTSGTQFVHADDITGIEADGRYSVVHMTSGEKHHVTRNIGEFEDELSSFGFYRVHKSWLINCTHVRRVTNIDGGTAILSTGQKVLIARRKKSDFLKRMAH
jgi:two-component system LytT family response regulator